MLRKGKVGSHRKFHLKLAGLEVDAPLCLTSPFAEFDLTCLPPNTKLIEVFDKVHIAAIALSEVLRVACHDLDVSNKQSTENDASLRMKVHARFYTRLLKDRISDNHPIFNVSQSDADDVTAVIDLLARAGVSARSIEVAAIALVARYYQWLIESALPMQAEAASSSNVLDRLRAYWRRVDQVLAAQNANLMKAHTQSVEGQHLKCIYKPVQGNRPVVALISRRSYEGKVRHLVR